MNAIKDFSKNNNACTLKCISLSHERGSTMIKKFVDPLSCEGLYTITLVYM